MWIVIPLIIAALVFIVRLAVNPIGTIVAALRVALFVGAAALWIVVLLTISSDFWTGMIALVFAFACTVLWVLSLFLGRRTQ